MNSLKKIRYLAIGLSLLILAGGALLLHPSARPLLESIFGQGELRPVEFERLELSGEEDGFLVCHPDFCLATEPHLAAPSYAVSVAALREAMLSAIDNSPTFFRRSLDLEIQQFEFTDRVPNSPFPDVVTIRFISLEIDRSSLAIYSRTIAGRPEPGRNQNRVASLLEVVNHLRE